MTNSKKTTNNEEYNNAVQAVIKAARQCSYMLHGVTKIESYTMTAGDSPDVRFLHSSLAELDRAIIKHTAKQFVNDDGEWIERDRDWVKK